MKKPFALFLFLSVMIYATAQSGYRPGYVVTLDADTLHGEINFKSVARNAEMCEFRESPESVTTIYRPGEISGYQFVDNRYYVSWNMGTEASPEWVFLEYLVDGDEVDL